MIRGISKRQRRLIDGAGFEKRAYVAQGEILYDFTMNTTKLVMEVIWISEKFT